MRTTQTLLSMFILLVTSRFTTVMAVAVVGFVTFNGAECGSPGSIDGAFYMAKGIGHSLHRHRHIEGHCNNIHKGKVRVGFWVGKCVSGDKLADANTGWGTLSRIFIEEVAKAQQ